MFNSSSKGRKMRLTIIAGYYNKNIRNRLLPLQLILSPKR